MISIIKGRMKTADVANNLNKYYFSTTWTNTCAAMLDYINFFKSISHVQTRG